MKKFLFIFSLFIYGISCAQSVPYNVNKRKFPLGDEFQKLLPPTLGEWQRYAFHDYLPGQETGHVYYRKDKKEIYVEFGKATNQSDMSIIWTKLYNDEASGKESYIKSKNLTSTSTKYLLINSTKTYYFAWTRNLYYFSLKTKSKAEIDEFMKIFPY